MGKTHDLTRGMNSNDPARNIILKMQRDGVISQPDGPDGKVTVTATREQLESYGLDADKVIGSMENGDLQNYPMVDINVMSDGTTRTVLTRDISKKDPHIQNLMARYLGDDPEDTLTMVHDPSGGKPMMIGLNTLRQARAAGQPFTELTDEELRTWKEREGEEASVRFISHFEHDPLLIMDVTDVADNGQRFHDLNHEKNRWFYDLDRR